MRNAEDKMNDKPKPWSVKGISPEARKLARQAANQAGLPIGRWLDTIIQQQAGAPISVDPAKTASPSGGAEARIEDLVATLSGKIDDMNVRLALVQAGRGLPAEDIALLDRMRTGARFEYEEEFDEPMPVVAATAEPEQAPRSRHGLRYAAFCTLLLMGLGSSYIAVSGALVVPPAGLSNTISQITATVGPALRDLGFSGQAPVQPAVASNDLPEPPMSRVNLRQGQPARSLEGRAQDGDASAQYELARAYAAGKDRQRSHAKAAHWLKLAANQGHTQASYELGNAFADGRGVPTSAHRAAAWYGNAADKGHRSAQYALGLAYAEGNGLPRDYAKATSWLERAARAGRADAQFALALLHERGFASNASIEAAHRWYKSAANNGFPQAAQRAEALMQQPDGIPLTPPRTVSDRASLTEIQQLLTDLGFDPGPVDGRVGNKTNTAIRLYQATLGLKVDGEPTDHLLAHLRTVTGDETAG